MFAGLWVEGLLRAPFGVNFFLLRFNIVEECQARLDVMSANSDQQIKLHVPKMMLLIDLEALGNTREYVVKSEPQVIHIGNPDIRRPASEGNAVEACPLLPVLILL